jgi:sulfate transport system ATP-binding protein
VPYDLDDEDPEVALNAPPRPNDHEGKAAVCVRGVKKQFSRYPALNGVSLDVRPGELLALLGPSGSGKTTLLRTIAGLEFPDVGQVLFDDVDVTYASAAARRVGFVFQQYALFRHMTVAKNIGFGLSVRKRKDRPDRKAIDARVEELLNLIELPGLGERYPAELSGGQRQRVALARALAVSPRVLLLDEPFGALDATVRKSLRRELRRIHDAAGVATVFVTHDQEEALELADRVAVLNQGRIEQVGSPAVLRDNPATAFVAGFVGEANRLEGTVSGGVFRLGALELGAQGVADGPALAFVRPDQLEPAEQGLEITVDRVAAAGLVIRIDGVDAVNRRLEVALPRGLQGDALAPGATMALKAVGGSVFAAPNPETSPKT